MKRLILLVMLGLLTASLAFAGQIRLQSRELIKVSLEVGKNPEGMAVNPVTHKAYVIAEQDTEGDDQYCLFILDNNVVSLRGGAPKKLDLHFGATIQAPKTIPIPNESEYIAIDSTRNLIYVSTKFHAAQDEPPDTGDDSGGEVDAPGGMNPPVLAPVTVLEPVPVTLGTLTVVDGNTDTVIATWYFSPGMEPEGVAVDPVNGVVYVGAKAPEGEAQEDDTCSSGTPIFDVGEPGDVECWTAGHIYAFFVEPEQKAIAFLKDIPAGDDPESVVFVNGMVYAANEDDGTVTVASAVYPDGTGGELLTDLPIPPTQPYGLGVAPYSLGVFYAAGPNPLACTENKFEADKMAAGGGSVFITDDRSRVAKITGIFVMNTVTVAGATQCLEIPNTDGGGANTANNIAYMQKPDKALLYVVSEQNTVAIYNPTTMKLTATITIPGAVHLDAIGVDGAANRVWITDEDLHAVFVLQGACANGTRACGSY